MVLSPDEELSFCDNKLSLLIFDIRISTGKEMKIGLSLIYCKMKIYFTTLFTLQPVHIVTLELKPLRMVYICIVHYHHLCYITV